MERDKFTESPRRQTGRGLMEDYFGAYLSARFDRSIKISLVRSPPRPLIPANCNNAYTVVIAEIKMRGHVYVAHR